MNESDLAYFYDESIAEVSKVVLNASFTVSTLLLPLMVYLILMKSKRLGKYKWYMLNNITWCYAYDLQITLMKPSFLMPFIGGYSQAPFPVDWRLACSMIELGVFLRVNMDLSVVLSLLYRYAQAFPGWIRDFFEDSYLVYVAYLALHLFCYITVVLPVRLGRMESGEAIRAYLTTTYPALDGFKDANGLFGYVRSSGSSIYTFWVFVFLISVFLGGTGLYLLLLFRIRSTRFNSYVKSTYRLQMMLFRAFSVQMLLGYFFLLFPVSLGMLTTSLALPHGGAINSVFLMMTSVHASLDFLAVLYFITPYRRCIIRLVSRMLMRKSSVFQGVRPAHVSKANSSSMCNSTEAQVVFTRDTPEPC